VLPIYPTRRSCLTPLWKRFARPHLLCVTRRFCRPLEAVCLPSPCQTAPAPALPALCGVRLPLKRPALVPARPSALCSSAFGSGLSTSAIASPVLFRQPCGLSAPSLLTFTPCSISHFRVIVF